MKRAYVALGSNIEPREEYLADALQMLDSNDKIITVKKSSIYQTAPVGYTDQGDFLNMVVEIDTSLPSEELLDFCQYVERHLGRKRDIRFGPRTIDLDILVYNQENSKTERLTIPHPRMHKRAFVLIPLHEIVPDLQLTDSSKTVSNYIEELSESDKKDVKRWTRKD
ncbi:2-amino-4-hydroxy-6-hydroxymethyldihydropteridine diphosphokinase [Virgibacillus doumboii]|uniref:2-amino-4-hydroxy-6- hydroxymethyldihydropteridine diphosphokinase n=1 Tax=Virgibacillus doumboii TaxID=2697503 RepID=UPI0013E0877B|nr:2-amino-4-hydroxy-6-hydroxymethyldihydropteridine diphosphokinase [Virgibacillus doumboii]